MTDPMKAEGLQARQTDSLEWNDLSVILAICRAGTLSGAARMLGHNHSTVFRRINAIEQKTGVRFFERLPNGYSMTDAGEAAMHSAERIESEIQGLSREILGRDQRLQGLVRITAMDYLAIHVLPGALAEFRELHPGVSYELLYTISALDLARREADIAIRAMPKVPDSSLGRKVCDFRFGIYAAPVYLERNRDKPLAEHDWVMIEGVADWLVPAIWKTRQAADRQTVFTSSGPAVIAAAEAGMGLFAMSCYAADSRPGLVPVSRPIEAMTVELWVLTHADLRHTARVKALMDYLVEYLRGMRDLFEGRRALEDSRVLFDTKLEPLAEKLRGRPGLKIKQD
jgi:DNA-binding transcriptional LysR family regulator